MGKENYGHATEAASHWNPAEGGRLETAGDATQVLTPQGSPAPKRPSAGIGSTHHEVGSVLKRATACLFGQSSSGSQSPRHKEPTNDTLGIKSQEATAPQGILASQRGTVYDEAPSLPVRRLATPPIQQPEGIASLLPPAVMTARGRIHGEHIKGVRL